MTDDAARLKFYTDTHIAKAVAVQLRSRGVDVVRCEEVGLANADDETHLRYATMQGRAVVTHDQDFLVLNARWFEQGRSHSGIFFIQRHLQGNIGQIVRRLAEYAELIAGGAGSLEADIVNQVNYVG